MNPPDKRYPSPAEAEKMPKCIEIGCGHIEPDHEEHCVGDWGHCTCIRFIQFIVPPLPFDEIDISRVATAIYNAHQLPRRDEETPEFYRALAIAALSEYTQYSHPELLPFTQIFGR